MEEDDFISDGESVNGDNDSWFWYQLRRQQLYFSLYWQGNNFYNANL